MPQDLNQQPPVAQNSSHSRDSLFDDYPEFVNRAPAVSDAELDEAFASAGFASTTETKRADAIKTLESKLETPSASAEAQLGGPSEPAKVIVGGVQKFGNIVADGVRTAYDFVSNFGQQSKDFDSTSTEFFGAVPTPDTPAGKASQELLTYLAPLAIGGPIAGVGKSIVAGGVIDFLGIDPKQDRLSNLVQEVPWLRNPMAAAMMHTPGESQLKGRTMNMLEGVLTMGLGYAAFKGVKGAASSLMPKKAAEALTESLAVRKAAEETMAPPKAPEVKAPEVKAAEAVAPEVKAALIERPAFSIDATKTTKYKSVEEMSEAVGINLEKLNTTDDVLQAVTEFAVQNKKLIDTVRPTQTFEETIAAAEKLYGDRAALDKLILSGLTPKAAEDTLAAQVVAHKMLTQAVANETVKLSRAAAVTTTAESLTAYADARDKFLMVFASMRGKQTEIAVAQSAGRIVLEAGIPLGDRAKFFEEAIRLSGGSENILNEIKQINLIADMPAANFTATGAGEIAKASKSMRYAHALGFYTLNNILTLKSLGNATVGNFVNTVFKDISLLSAAGIGTTKKYLMGATDTYTFTDATREVYGQMSAIKEAFVNAGKSLKEAKSFTPGGDIARIDTPLNIPNPLGAENLFGLDSGKSKLAKIWNTAIAMPLSLPTRLIGPADSFFGTITYRGRQYANGLREAERMGLPTGKLDAFMSEYMSKTIDVDAVKHAENITLSGTNAISSFVNQHLPIAKTLFPIMRTEINGMKFIFENSPFMLATSKARKATGREADLIYGGVATGVAGVGLMTWLAHDGIITGDVPQNPTVYKALKESNSGWQPNSVKTSAGYIPIEKFGILGSILKIGAFINDARNFVHDDEYQQLMTAGAAAIFDAHTSEQFISNIGDFFTALGDIEAQGKNNSKAANVALAFVQRLQPLGAIQNQIAREIDPILRSNITYTKGMGAPEAFLEKAKILLKGRTPWLSEYVPPRVNFFGEPQFAPSGWLPFTEDVPGAETVAHLISPFARSLDDTSPLIKELKDLAGFSEHLRPNDPDMPTLNLQMPTNIIPNKIDGSPFQLTSEEYYNFMIRSAGRSPKTGEVVSSNGMDLRETISLILSQMGKKEISEIYMQQNGPIAVKKILSQIQRGIMAYRKQGYDYLFNDANVLERMHQEFEARNAPGSMRKGP